MKFITAEEFLKQSDEIQAIFMSWWQCDNGDLFIDKREYERDKVNLNIECCNLDLEGNIEGNFNYLKTIAIPLFTVGQLVEFIEDKTNCKISIRASLERKYYIGYNAFANNEDGDLCRLVYTDTILEGLWLVALKVANYILKGCIK